MPCPNDEQTGRHGGADPSTQPGGMASRGDAVEAEMVRVAFKYYGLTKEEEPTTTDLHDVPGFAEKFVKADYERVGGLAAWDIRLIGMLYLLG